ncbi:MAG: hypothetical protein ACTSU5_15390 [Promethearchaeota archaeon]
MTKYDPATYVVEPNLTVWRIASVVSAAGAGTFIFILDRAIFNFQFKGVLAYIVYAIGVMYALVPIHTLDEFTLVSNIALIGGLVILSIPFMFFWLGWKNPSLRRVSFIVGLGILIFAVGGTLLGENIMQLGESILGPGVRVFLIVASVVLRIVGLLMLSYGALNMKI